MYLVASVNETEMVEANKKHGPGNRAKITVLHHRKTNSREEPVHDSLHTHIHTSSSAQAITKECIQV